MKRESGVGQKDSGGLSLRVIQRDGDDSGAIEFEGMPWESLTLYRVLLKSAHSYR